MDNPHFSNIDEESAINCLNPRDRKGGVKVWLWRKYSDRMHAESKEIVQPNAVYRTGAIKLWVQKPYKIFLTKNHVKNHAFQREIDAEKL